MRINDLQPGTRWAFRRTRELAADAIEVEICRVMNVRPKQVEVVHVSGDAPGLREFVKPSQLVAPWSGWPALQKHERRLAELIAVAEMDAPDAVEREAANTVFAAAGEDVYVDDRTSYSVADRKALDRLADRANAQNRPWLHRPSFVEHGDVWTTNQILVDLAVQLAAAEPHMVHLYLDQEETEYEARGYEPGQRYLHDLLRRYKPSWALARQWAGGQAARREHDREIARLRDLVGQAVTVLYRHNLEEDARRIERALSAR